MLTILGDRSDNGFCDGMPRRSFLSIGSLAMGGLSLPQILQAEEEQKKAVEGSARNMSPHKAVIDLPAWRPTPSGYVCPENGCSERDPGRVQSDSN